MLEADPGIIIPGQMQQQVQVQQQQLFEDPGIIITKHWIEGGDDSGRRYSNGMMERLSVVAESKAVASKKESGDVAVQETISEPN